MKIRANKRQENKSQSVSAASSQKQNSSESTSHFVDNRPEAVVQRKRQEMANNSPQVNQTSQFQSMVDNHAAQQQLPIQKKENNTGLPNNLKTGMENISGQSLDDVKVHRNSDQPAQLNAHAFARGSDIHLAPGQEKHLPHELGHVVQQKEGRVQPTKQFKGKTNINDNPGLEKEADNLGAKALQNESGGSTQLKSNSNTNSSNQTVQLNGADKADLAIGVADQATGIAKLAHGSDAPLFNRNTEATGELKTNTTEGAGQSNAHIADSATNVAGTLMQGYKAFESWKNMTATDDPLAKADAALQGTKFVYSAYKTGMTIAKSSEITGLIPGIGSGLNLLEAGLNLMKDTRAQNAIEKLKKREHLSPEEDKVLKEYGRRVFWKMIEDGAEAAWSVGELIGLAFPGVNAGISFVHSGVNLLKDGVKMYRSYGAGKNDQAASRLEVGGIEGITEDEKASLSKTGDLVKNAGGSHIDFVRLLRLFEEETRLTESQDDPSRLTTITNELNSKIDKYNEMFGTGSGIANAENISRAQISAAKIYFVNLVRSLKDDVLKSQSMFSRFQHSLPGVHLQRKIDAKPLFEQMFGVNNDKTPSDLELLMAAENDPTGSGGYIDTKLGETVRRAQKFSIKDISNDKLTSSIVDILGKEPAKFYETFHNLDSEIFEGAVIPDSATFTAGLKRYFDKINPF